MVGTRCFTYCAFLGIISLAWVFQVVTKVLLVGFCCILCGCLAVQLLVIKRVYHILVSLWFLPCFIFCYRWLVAFIACLEENP